MRRLQRQTNNKCLLVRCAVASTWKGVNGRGCSEVRWETSPHTPVQLDMDDEDGKIECVQDTTGHDTVAHWEDGHLGLGLAV